jgi:hypothetical protein
VTIYQGGNRYVSQMAPESVHGGNGHLSPGHPARPLTLHESRLYDKLAKTAERMKFCPSRAEIIVKLQDCLRLERGASIGGNPRKGKKDDKVQRC